MKRLATILIAMFVTSMIFIGCGKGGGRPSAKSQLDKLEPANVSDPALLSDAVGSALGFSQFGMDFYGDMGMMGAMKSLKVPVLKGKKLEILQYGGGENCDPFYGKCTWQCPYGGTSTLECSGDENSGSCNATASNCKEEPDVPPSNGTVEWTWSTKADGSAEITLSLDITIGDGYAYGSYKITFTPTSTGGTVKLTLDITGADYNEPSNVGYIYFDETVVMKDIGNYEFKATINGNGAFGTTEDGKVTIAIEDVVVNPSQCWMEPLSGTVTVSAGNDSVTVTFDGGTNCDGKVTCSGAFNGEIDISGSSEIEF